MLLFPVCNTYSCASFTKPNGLSVGLNCMLGKVDFCFLLKEHFLMGRGIYEKDIEEGKYKVR